MKEAVRNVMRISNCPLGFWDCVERRARINNLAALKAYPLHGETPPIMMFFILLVIYEIFASLSGMNGAISETMEQLFLTVRKY